MDWCSFGQLLKLFGFQFISALDVRSLISIPVECTDATNAYVSQYLNADLHFLFTSTKSVHLRKQLYHNFSPLTVMSYIPFRRNLAESTLMFSIQALREVVSRSGLPFCFVF